MEVDGAQVGAAPAADPTWRVVAGALRPPPNDAPAGAAQGVVGAAAAGAPTADGL